MENYFFVCDCIVGQATLFWAEPQLNGTAMKYRAVCLQSTERQAGASEKPDRRTSDQTPRRTVCLALNTAQSYL